MPDTHRVIITNEALTDLEEIAAYIRRSSPQNVATVCARIVAAIDGLSSMPARFKRVGHSRKRGSPVHGLTVRPFIIYYRVDAAPSAVFILNVRHGAQQQPHRFD